MFYDRIYSKTFRGALWSIGWRWLQERVDGPDDARSNCLLPRCAGGARGFERLGDEERLDGHSPPLPRPGEVALGGRSQEHQPAVRPVRGIDRRASGGGVVPD